MSALKEGGCWCACARASAVGLKRGHWSGFEQAIGVLTIFDLEVVLKLIPDVTHVRRFVMLSVAEASVPPELVRDELV